MKLKAGKFAAVQARELWSTEEKIHLRPGHFWVCELGDADGNGSPILHEFTRKNEVFTLSTGAQVRGSIGESVLLLRRYYHRTAVPTIAMASPLFVGRERRVRSLL